MINQKLHRAVGMARVQLLCICASKSLEGRMRPSLLSS